MKEVAEKEADLRLNWIKSDNGWQVCSSFPALISAGPTRAFLWEQGPLGGLH